MAIQLTDTDKAIELAEQIRQEHNGIFGLRLFLGHDGHNVCSLEDYETEIGRGESGVSLFQAIERAHSDFRFRKLTSGESWGEETVVSAIENAIVDMASERGIFCSAGFCAALNEDAYAVLSQTQCNEILEKHPCVVRLKCGTMWMLLPGKMERYISPTATP